MRLRRSPKPDYQHIAELELEVFGPEPPKPRRKKADWVEDGGVVELGVKALHRKLDAGAFEVKPGIVWPVERTSYQQVWASAYALTAAGHPPPSRIVLPDSVRLQ